MKPVELERPPVNVNDAIAEPRLAIATSDV
jgi:hypothetical protein